MSAGECACQQRAAKPGEWSPGHSLGKEEGSGWIGSGRLRQGQGTKDAGIPISSLREDSCWAPAHGGNEDSQAEASLATAGEAGAPVSVHWSAPFGGNHPLCDGFPCRNDPADESPVQLFLPPTNHVQPVRPERLVLHLPWNHILRAAQVRGQPGVRRGRERG